MPNYAIRKAKLPDLPVLVTIYNQAILAHQTADTIPIKLADRKSWFESHQDLLYPLFVIAEKEQVMGYATLSKYREGRPALRFIVEISYYIHRDHQRKGLGSALLKYVLEIAKELGFKHAFALLLDTNLPSRRLLKKFGFEQWGHLPNVAEMNGQICGQFYFGRRL